MSLLFYQALDEGIVARVANLRQGWLFVGSAFGPDNEHCINCRHNQIIGRVNYEGLHRVVDVHAACTLGRKDGESPEQCPAYAAYIASDEGDAT